MGRPKGSANKAKVHRLDELAEHIKSVKSFKVSYDFGNFEGGIAVFVSFDDYGTTIVSVPRLRLSTCVMHDYDVTEMLTHNRIFYNDRKLTDQFVQMILRDIQCYRHKGA